MGNRAVITFSTAPKTQSLYLHWNGGRASVEGFLEAARQTNQTTIPAIAELVAAHFFETRVNESTVYTQPYENADTDNGDNGVYVLDTGLNIVERLFARSEEIDADKTAEITERIVESFNAAKK